MKHIGFLYRAPEVVQTNIGFIDPATEIVDKHLVYRSGQSNCWKHIGSIDIDRATETIEKTLVL